MEMHVKEVYLKFNSCSKLKVIIIENSITLIESHLNQKNIQF